MKIPALASRSLEPLEGGKDTPKTSIVRDRIENGSILQIEPWLMGCVHTCVNIVGLVGRSLVYVEWRWSRMASQRDRCSTPAARLLCNSSYSSFASEPFSVALALGMVQVVGR